MRGSTLLGIAIGAIAGAFLVDTFQPAQDLLDNCKSEIKSKVKTVKGSVKQGAKKVQASLEDK